jgi:hypothetical protein
VLLIRSNHVKHSMPKTPAPLQGAAADDRDRGSRGGARSLEADPRGSGTVGSTAADDEEAARREGLWQTTAVAHSDCNP